MQLLNKQLNMKTRVIILAALFKNKFAICNLQFAICIALLIASCLLPIFSFAQNVGINAAGASPNISAILDIDAQPGFNKGLLIPRVTYSQRIGTNFNPLSAAAQGLTVYQTDAGGLGEGFYFNTSTSTTPAWSFLLNNTSGWSLTGNAATTPSSSAIGTAIAAGQNYVGTSDFKDFVLATNNLERLRINSAGNIGIGTSTPGTLLDVNGSTRALLYTFPAPTGDPAPFITTRTVPSGQGASAEKTELILFHGNDPANAAGADQITLRAPALSFQTFNDVNVLDMNNSVGYNERMYINSIGNVGIGTILPERLLHVAVSATDGVNGSVLNSYEIVQFKVHAGGGAKRGLEIGAPTGSIVSPVYLKVHGTSNRFAILNETNSEQFTILNSGNVGIGTAAPSQKLQVSGGNIIIDNTNWYYGFNTSGATQPLIRSRGMGYSPSTYPGLQLGQTGDNIALFIDPNSITGGAFNGNIENEIFLPNTTSFRQANSGATDWISTMYLNNGNIGIGTTTPSTQLHSTGGVRFQILAGTGTRMVVADASGNLAAGSSIASGIVTGSGTLNYVPKWTPDGATLGNSSIFDNGNVGIGTITPGAKLHVEGITFLKGPNNNTFGQLSIQTTGTVGHDAQITFATAANGRGLYVDDDDVNKLKFYTGYGKGVAGKEVTFDNEGNVGIGTTSPARELHISSASGAQIKLQGTTGNWNGLEFLSTGYNGYMGMEDNSGRFFIDMNSNGEDLSIIQSGNVGIGTTAPAAKLEISQVASDAGGNGLTITGTGTGAQNWQWYPSSNQSLNLMRPGLRLVRFGNDGSFSAGGLDNDAGASADFFVNGTSGNVGIGTTSPGAKLEIAGQIKITGGAPGAGKVLTSDASGLATWNAASTGTVTGSGTLNYVPKWTPNGTTLGNSSIFDNGTNVGIGTISPGAPLQVNGEIVANGLFGAVTGAPDNTIWGVSKDTYPTWGMFYNEGSPDYIEFKTGGTVSSRITLDDGSAHFGLNGGNVGIGNNSPQEKLDVRGSLATSISNTQVVGKLYNAASDGFLELYTGEATPISRIKLSAYGNSYFAPANNGNIGIGTTSPTLGKLNVVSAANTLVSALRIESSGTLANNDIVRMQINGLTNGFRMFQDGSSNVIYSFQDGNVGIGTTSPGAKLEIAGQIKITGGSPGINKVLTSDATGLASWQNSGGTPFSGSVTSGNWYRIASNPGNRCNAEFTLRDFISGGGHSTATFRVGTSYNYASGTSFTLLNHNQYSGATFTKVRVLQATTYDPQYLEVYVERTGSVEFSVYDNLQANGWVPIAWTAGGIPGGYTDREFNIDNLFVVGDYDDRLTINRGGNVGIGTTSPGSKLDVAGQIRIRNGNGIAFERDLGQSDYSTFVDAYGFPSQGYGAGGAANYWVRLASKGGTHIVLNTDGGAGSGENSFDHFTVWQGAVDGDKLFNVSNIGNTYIKGNLGIGTTSPTKKLQVTGGSLLSTSILTDGYVQDVSGIVQGNYIPSQNWNIASGSVGIFNDNGGAGDNTREWGDGPDGNRAILWKGFGSGTDADGGWNTSVFDIDHTKSYRVSVWVKKTGVNSGTTYLGIQGSNVTYLNGVAEGNPYFFCGTPPKLDQWYLIVGYIHGSGDASLVGSGGLYDGSTGLKVVNFGGLGNCGADYKFTTAATTQQQRAYLYYNNNSSARQYFFNPRFEEVNGKEIPIAALLGAPVMWQEFSTPLIKEFSFSGSGSQTITLPSSVPVNARYVLADIFVTANFSDHQNFVLGRASLGAEKNWVDSRGQQPSSQFGNLARHSVTLTYFGEADGYSSNYGIWYSSQLVPVSGQTMYYQNYGNSGSSGWLYMVIRSYSN